MTYPDPASAIMASAPELIQSPGLAADAIRSGTPADSAQVLSHTSGHAGVQSALDDVADPGEHDSIIGKIGHFFGRPVHAVGHVGMKALEGLAAPLHEVQHQYRYLSDVSERHGMLASTLERLAMITAGAVGTIATGNPYAGILAAEGTGEVMGHVFFRDSWDKTADGENYRDKHGNRVNPGYDLANIVDNVIHGHDYEPSKGVDMPTGIVNAIFDLTLDPLVGAGKVGQLANLRGVKALGLVGKDANPRTAAEVAAMAARPSVTDIQMPADRVLEAYRGRQGVQKMTDILSKASTEEILTKYPRLKPLAAELGAATTHDDVLNVFRDALTARNYSVLSHGLPTTALTRTPLVIANAKNAILNAGSKDATYANDILDAQGNVVHKAGDTIVSDVTGNAVETPKAGIRSLTTYRAFNVSDDLKSLSAKEMNLGDSSAAGTLHSILKISQNSRTATAITARFMQTSDITERLNIYVNSVTDMLRAAGLPEDSELVTRWKGHVSELADSTQRAVYGVSKDGQPLHLTDEAGEPLNVGLLLNQQGKVALPNFQEIRKAQRELGDENIFGRLADKAGHVDDWIYQHYTTRIFKSLALLSLGFAFRVSAGELIPASIKYGTPAVLRGTLAAASEKLNPGLAEIASSLPKAENGDHALSGVLVKVKDDARIGRIKTVSDDGKMTTVTHNVDGKAVDTDYRTSELTAFHAAMRDKELMQLAKDAGIQLDREELSHVRAAAGKALYGVSRALGDKDYLLNAHLTVLNNNGHIVAPALNTSHGSERLYSGINSTNQALKALGRQLPPGYRLGSKFSTYGGSDALHELYWQNAINEAAADPGISAAAKAWKKAKADGLSDEEARKLAEYADRQVLLGDARFKANMLGAAIDVRQYAAVRHDLMMGLAHGKDAAGNYIPHDFVLDSLAEGKAPSLPELAEIPVADRPVVKGRVLEPIPVGKGGLLQQVTNTGFKKFIDPIINHMSREPIYTTAVTQQYKQLKPFIEAGYLDPAQANWISQQRAVNDMLPLIHNTELRSQFSELARNYMPFYFAQEQAYRRYGSVIFSDPVKFEKFRLAVHGLHSSGIIQENGGESYIVFPGAGKLGEYMTAGAGMFGLGVMGGVPSAVSGNIASLKSVTPAGLLGESELPGMSPLLAVSLKGIEQVFPSSEPALSELMGPIASNQSAWDSMIPNATLKRLVQASPAGENSRSFHTAFMYTIANAARRSQDLRAQAETAGVDTPRGKSLLAQADEILPGPDSNPQNQQKAIDRIRNSTRILFLYRAMFGAVAPMSPRFDVGDYGLRSEVAAEIKKAGDPGVGLQNFLEKHPDATPDTVFLSDAKYTGANVPAGEKALQWMRDNRGLVDTHQLAAAYLLPQTADFSQEAYNQELAAGLRQRRSTDDFVSALYEASTNAKFYPSLEAKNAALKEHPEQKSEINAQWSAYIQQLGAANPIWFRDLNDPQKGLTAHLALKDLREVLDRGSVESPQSELIRTLIAGYDEYARTEVMMKSRGISGLGELKNQWDTYLTEYVKQFPQAQAVVNGVFRRLPSYDLASAGSIQL